MSTTAVADQLSLFPPAKADGAGTVAQFDRPSGVAVDSFGNIYVTDRLSHRIRKITPGGVGGLVTTLAGDGTMAQDNNPSSKAGVVSTLAGDGTMAQDNNPSSKAGVVSTLAGSGKWGYKDATGIKAQFNNPSGVAVDSKGNVYVADTFNNRIRKIIPEGEVSTLAGGKTGFKDGTGTAARFKSPKGVAVDLSGNVYVADSGNHLIRKVTPEGEVSILAGDGTTEYFNYPEDVTVDVSGNIYVADYENHRIQKITSEGIVITIAGSSSVYKNATDTEPEFYGPYDVAVDSSDNIYIADYANHRIQKITPGGVVSLLTGNGGLGYEEVGRVARFKYPSGIAVDSSGDLYVADSANHCIRKIEYK